MGEGAAGQIARLSALPEVPMIRFPQSSLALLELFAQRKLNLTEKEFQDHFDSVLIVLERANDEKFRLTPEGDSGDAP